MTCAPYARGNLRLYGNPLPGRPGRRVLFPPLVRSLKFQPGESGIHMSPAGLLAYFDVAVATAFDVSPAQYQRKIPSQSPLAIVC